MQNRANTFLLDQVIAAAAELGSPRVGVDGNVKIHAREKQSGLGTRW
ncbi:MAG: hypothetical protein M3O82_03540 [Verrucomicrobiota bacterium]|nr:hypothetical protein [Verrucomicrobiota bacterium]